MSSGFGDPVHARHGKAVLAIDDSWEMLTILKATITAAGYDFVSARNAVEGIARLQQRRPDVILLDVQMPEKDGFEVCREIHRVARWKDLPVIFVTALNTESDIRRCLEAGGRDFIVKPFSTKTLLRRLDRWALNTTEA